MAATTKALVVGGTAGIGYAIACNIAAKSPSTTVIISGRNKPKHELPHPNIEFRALDASSMRAIKQYTDSFKQSSTSPPPKLDLLILTQGILTMSGRSEPFPETEKIDRKLALHFYGRQLLIRELLPVLSDDAKVLIVLDGTRGSPSKLIWDDLDLKRNYSISNAANHAVGMTDGMVQAWAAQQAALSNGTTKRHFIHAFPGFVQTNSFGNLPWYLRGASRVVSNLLATSPEQCAENLVKGMYEVSAEGGPVEKEGRFWSCINDKGKLVANKAAWTPEQIKKVEEHTWDVVDGAIKAADAAAAGGAA